MTKDSRTDSLETKVAVIASTVLATQEDVVEIKRSLQAQYVTIDKHALVVDKVDRLEKIIYGLILAVLTGLIGLGFTLLR